MRRLPALAALGALSVLSIGCGFASYEQRLEATQGRLRDEMTLNTVLYVPEEGSFKQNSIYFRRPQGLEQRPQFQLIPLTPGYFEVEASYVPPGSGDDQLASGPFLLHVLARRTSEENAQAPPEGQPGQEQPQVARGDFRSDVLAVLAQVYGAEIASAPVEPVNKTIWPHIQRSADAPPLALPYERITLTDRNQQLIHIYFYNEQSGDATYDAALIWEFPGGEAAGNTSDVVDMTLGTLAVGQRATSRFSGRPDGVEGGDDAGASSIAF